MRRESGLSFLEPTAAISLLDGSSGLLAPYLACIRRRDAENPPEVVRCVNSRVKASGDPGFSTKIEIVKDIRDFRVGERIRTAKRG